MERKVVEVGNLKIGDGKHIVLQSMCNTNTEDIAATVDQVKRLVDTGCELVRITTPALKHVACFAKIKNALHSAHYTVPLVADVHYMPDVAQALCGIADKIRINPGNYSDHDGITSRLGAASSGSGGAAAGVSSVSGGGSGLVRGSMLSIQGGSASGGVGSAHQSGGKCSVQNGSNKAAFKLEYTEEEHQAARERIKNRIGGLFESCKKHGTALRIGVNMGSLSSRMIATYGHSPKAMVESALEFLDIAQEMDFDNIVFSMKSSSTKKMCLATQNLHQAMKERGKVYPLHIGVTEAGNGLDGRLISAVGIGAMLKAGIGDTIRVSLTEAPEKEIDVAKKIVEYAKIFAVESTEEALKEISKEDLPIAAAVFYGDRFMKGEGDCILQDPLKSDLYQAAEYKFYKTRIVACPSCGRTAYDIETALNKVKARFSNYKGLNIAVMGCVVNGPGEMLDADYGYIGCGGGKVNIYRAQKLVYSNIDENCALDKLEDLIEADRSKE